MLKCILQFLVDLALGFGATEKPLQFAEPAGATAVVLSKKIESGAYFAKTKLVAPEFVTTALEATRPTGFSREYRLRHDEYRKFHGMPEQPVPVPSTELVVVGRRRRYTRGRREKLD